MAKKIKLAKIKPIHIAHIKVKNLNRKVNNTFKEVGKAIKKPIDTASKLTMTTLSGLQFSRAQ